MQGKILVVEPDPPAGRTLVRALRRAGYDVIWVRDGEQAGGRLEQETFQLMILDISDPARADLRVLNRRKALAPDMPILVLIDYGSDDQSAYAAGADAVQQKPLDTIALRTWIRTRLGHDDPPDDGRRHMLARRDSEASDNPPSDNPPSDNPPSDVAPNDRIEVGTLVVDLGRGRATCNGQPLQLTPLEFGLLALLAQSVARS